MHLDRPTWPGFRLGTRRDLNHFGMTCICCRGRQWLLMTYQYATFGYRDYGPGESPIHAEASTHSFGARDVGVDNKRTCRVFRYIEECFAAHEFHTSFGRSEGDANLALR